MKNFSPWESELIKVEITASLENTLDQNFRRLIETARSVWERNFAGSDPSDACVSVRIAASDSGPEVQSTNGKDFVKASQTSARPGKATLALHLAH